jgi:nicotinate-nucleotide adenylyltransferase
MGRRAELLTPGLKVGLLGGSFNPAHEGHVHVTRMALKALGLDRVWWMVSPQNPLKPAAGMSTLEKRLADARTLAQGTDPRIVVTDIETRLGTRYTVDTIKALKARHREACFVWLMGADNMIQLPRWARWRELVREVPMAIYPRAPFTLRARTCRAADMLRPVTLEASDAALLPCCAAPAIVFLEGAEHPASATAIRAARPL